MTAKESQGKINPAQKFFLVSPSCTQVLFCADWRRIISGSSGSKTVQQCKGKLSILCTVYGSDILLYVILNSLITLAKTQTDFTKFNCRHLSNNRYVTTNKYTIFLTLHSVKSCLERKRVDVICSPKQMHTLPRVLSLPQCVMVLMGNRVLNPAKKK